MFIRVVVAAHRLLSRDELLLRLSIGVLDRTIVACLHCSSHSLHSCLRPNMALLVDNLVDNLIALMAEPHDLQVAPTACQTGNSGDSIAASITQELRADPLYPVPFIRFLMLYSQSVRKLNSLYKTG